MAVHVLRHRRSAAFAVVRTATVPGVLVGLLKALRLIRFPTLITAEEEHDIEALAHRPLFGVMRRLVSSHDVLNGLGRSNVEHLRRYGFPGSKITMIPNGIDTSAWETTTVPDHIERFLFLGRIDVTKGVFELVDAFAEVHARHPAVRLVIAGEGPALPALEARAAELGVESAVTFAGRVEYERLGDLFDAVDCLVLPSYSEGMPLSVLEAASHHRPLILTDVGDLRATFGESVRLCRPRDTAALAEAMEAAVSDPSPSANYDEVIERVGIGAVAGEILARLGVRAPQPTEAASASALR
jgi:glycosyltransferase involved in cell wall biosynthesis